MPIIGPPLRRMRVTVRVFMRRWNQSESLRGSRA